jgi:hypothetical protein
MSTTLVRFTASNGIVVYVNPRSVSSLTPTEAGSVLIWFLGGLNDAHIEVNGPIEQVVSLLLQQPVTPS